MNSHAFAMCGNLKFRDFLKNNYLLNFLVKSRLTDFCPIDPQKTARHGLVWPFFPSKWLPVIEFSQLVDLKSTQNNRLESTKHLKTDLASMRNLLINSRQIGSRTPHQPFFTCNKVESVSRLGVDLEKSTRID